MLAFAAFGGGGARAAEWQWSVPMGESRAFLWIPPDCERVRGIVAAQNNLLEEGVLEHAAMRRTLAELGFAAVFITPVFDPVFRFDRGAGARFEEMLRALAGISGYAELAAAPVVPLGHSACASFPWNFAAWNPARTLAIVSLKGDAPQTTLTGSGQPNPDWGTRSLDGIPGLMVMSEYEWWEDRLVPLVAFREAHPQVPLALLADAGRGHFDASDALVEFIALFIRKAAAARLPGEADPPAAGGAEGAGRVPALRPVDPARGWLADRWRGDEPLRVPAAPAAEYAEPEEAFWCFDEEMARATEAHYTMSRAKAPQQVDFIQEGALVPIATSHAGVELKFLPQDDGVTFKLGAGFISPLPPKAPVAAKDKAPPLVVITPHAATAEEHAPGNVRLARIAGPCEQLDDETFRVALNRASLRPGGAVGDIWLCAWHPGDATHKPAIQQALLRVPRCTEGAAQHIRFDAIPDQRRGATELKLAARSDAPGAAVRFFVREGPAEISGDTLRFTAVPPRAKFPLAVTVVAWELGRATEPRRPAATPVERTFLLTP